MWELKRYPASAFSRAETIVRNGPALDDSEVVPVIELEPLLDLLERMTEALEGKADPRRGASPVVELTQLRHDVLMATDLLRTHGRSG